MAVRAAHGVFVLGPYFGGQTGAQFSDYDNNGGLDVSNYQGQVFSIEVEDVDDGTVDGPWGPTLAGGGREASRSLRFT